MNVKIEESWKNALGAEFEKPYFKALTDFVRGEYMAGKRIYPAPANIFNAFNLCPLDAVRVVIIGQDPYHEPGQAHGLCFSVQENKSEGIGQRAILPPSLINIFKEIKNDLGIDKLALCPVPSDLSCWAQQGVLLLNSTLTVQAHLAASHAGKGWEQFTDSVIRAVAQRPGIVYLLWGSYAQRKAELVNAAENLVLKSVHPSPLSAHRGFFGNHHFSRANEYLASQGKPPIEW
jgi:uracil-DNA glycosylase